MNQSAKPARVQGGPPVWLWFLVGICTVAVIWGLVSSSTPEDPAKVYSEARALIESQKTDGLNRKLAFLKSAPGYEGHVHLLEGLQAQRSQRDPGAIESFNAIPDDHPLKAEAIERTADSYRKMGKFTEALAAYEQAVARDPDHAESARISLAQFYLGLGAYDLAKTTLDQVLADDPENETALQTRAVILQDQRDYEAALVDFGKILSTPGQFGAASPNLLRRYCECLLSAGATEKIQKVVDDHFSLLETPDLKVRLLLAINEVDKAAQALKAASDVDRELSDFRKIQLEIEMKREDWNAAEATLTSLLKVIPRNPWLYEQAVNVYQHTGQQDRAEIAQQNADQLNQLQDKLRESIKAVGGSVADAAMRADISRQHMNLGSYDEAVRWSSMAATLDSSLQPEAQKILNGENFPTKPLVPFTSAADSKPEDSKPEDSKPEDSKPEDSSRKTPSRQTPNRKTPSGRLQTGRLQTGRLQTGRLQTGRLQTGRLQTGRLQTGRLQTGRLQTGRLQTGRLQTGRLQTGRLQTGRLQTGRLQTGRLQTGRCGSFEPSSSNSQTPADDDVSGTGR
ncbi:MAG: tetratricopeptide repeat protein [Planctomycetaceae bacterium]